MLPRSLLIVALLVTLPGVVQAQPDQHRGFAAHYRPGLMEQVARRRGMSQTACMVASPYYKLGEWITVESRKHRQRLRCRITDVPQPKHRAQLRKRTIVVELDFKSARILCKIARVGQEPPRACPVVLARAE